MPHPGQPPKIKKIKAYYKQQPSNYILYFQFGNGSVGYGQQLIVNYSEGYMEWGKGLWGALWGGLDAPGDTSLSTSQQGNYFRVKFGSTTHSFCVYGYGILYKLKPIR